MLVGGRLSKGFVTAPVFVVDAQETFVHSFGWRKQEEAIQGNT